MPRFCPDCGHDHDRHPYSPAVFKVHRPSARGANGKCFHHGCSSQPVFIAEGKNGAPYAICAGHAATWDASRANLCPQWGPASAA